MRRLVITILVLISFMPAGRLAADCFSQPWLAGSATKITSCGDVTVAGNLNKSGSWILSDAIWSGRLEIHNAGWNGTGNDNYGGIAAGHGYFYGGLQTGGATGSEAGPGQLYVHGNVGFGTAPTQQRLTVAGNISKAGSWILSDAVWAGALEVHNSSWNGTNNDNYGAIKAGHAYFYNGLQTGGPGGSEAGPGQLYVHGSSTLNGAAVIGAAGGSGNKLTVNGDATFNGTVSGTNIKAHYQDVAEWVPAVGTMAAGTTVILDPTHNNRVMPSETAYDTRVAGVVSDQPGVILGVADPSKAMIATTGRVKVRVDASRSPIRIGDLLTTSGETGMAMRSEPIEIAGVKIHRPGTLIGKALEPLASGRGEILVLLSLQ